MTATVKKLTISAAKKIVKSMAQEHGNNLDLALACLNQITEQGIEFPTAVSLVLDAYDVSQDDLTNAYDDQF